MATSVARRSVRFEAGSIAASEEDTGVAASMAGCGKAKGDRCDTAMEQTTVSALQCSSAMANVGIELTALFPPKSPRTPMLRQAYAILIPSADAARHPA